MILSKLFHHPLTDPDSVSLLEKKIGIEHVFVFFKKVHVALNDEIMMTKLFEGRL